MGLESKSLLRKYAGYFMCVNRLERWKGSANKKQEEALERLRVLLRMTQSKTGPDAEREGQRREDRASCSSLEELTRLAPEASSG
ncbi:hypothetical protein KUCAC02_019254 [Chaenocephalus aceratus]|nr:hypothetical protein KUCAC02_019254 [Chaenocephalus aceratus]